MLGFLESLGPPDSQSGCRCPRILSLLQWSCKHARLLRILSGHFPSLLKGILSTVHMIGMLCTLSLSLSHRHSQLPVSAKRCLFYFYISYLFLYYFSVL